MVIPATSLGDMFHNQAVVLECTDGYGLYLRVGALILPILDASDTYYFHEFLFR